MLNVHVRVNDGSTGQPTPVRIRFVDAQGLYRPPLGRLAEFATDPGVEVGDSVRLGDANYAYIDGTCEVPLPPGAVTVEITKGPEYAPLVQTVLLAAGQLALRFTIRRWTDWRQQRWYSGDARVHDLSPHSALLEGAAEGLAVVQLLAWQRHAAHGGHEAITNIAAFSGTQSALSRPDCLVAVNTFNVHPHLGQVSLLNCHRPVYPLRSGFPGPDDWSVADWCDQCHRKQGLVVGMAPYDASPQGEALAALILGKVDALEICYFSDPLWRFLKWYYQILDCGFRVPLVGASGKDSNAIAAGAVRTYAQIAEGAEVGPDTWIEAVRAGRTFVTSGPLLSLRVEGCEAGGVVRCEPGQAVNVEVEAASGVRIEELQVVACGQVIASARAEAGGAKIQTRWAPERSAWLAVRCVGVEAPSAGHVFGHSSPVWLEVAGRPLAPTQKDVEPLLSRLEQTFEWIRSAARVPSQRQAEHFLEVIGSAIERLRSRVTAGGA